MTTYADDYERVKAFVLAEIEAGRQPGTLANIGARTDIKNTVDVSRILRNLETDEVIEVERAGPGQRKPNIYSLPGQSPPITGQLISDPIAYLGYTHVIPTGRGSGHKHMPMADYRRQEAEESALAEWARSLSMDEVRQLAQDDKALMVQMFIQSFGS